MTTRRSPMADRNFCGRRWGVVKRYACVLVRVSRCTDGGACSIVQRRGAWLARRIPTRLSMPLGMGDRTPMATRVLQGLPMPLSMGDRAPMAAREIKFISTLGRSQIYPPLPIAREVPIVYRNYFWPERDMLDDGVLMKKRKTGRGPTKNLTFVYRKVNPGGKGGNDQMNRNPRLKLFTAAASLVFVETQAAQTPLLEMYAHVPLRPLG